MNNERRLNNIAILQAWHDEIMLAPPGPERAIQAQRLGRAIAAMNSATTDKELGIAKLELYGVKGHHG